MKKITQQILIALIFVAGAYQASAQTTVFYEDLRYDNFGRGFTAEIVSDGGSDAPNNILKRIGAVPDLENSNNMFNPSENRPENRIPQGSPNDQRAISTSGNNGETNFPVNAYAVFTAVDLTGANPLISETDLYKYASFWSMRRYGEGDIALVTMEATTNYTGDPETTDWTTLSIVSGKLAENSDGLTYVKGVVDLTSLADGANGDQVTLALHYQGSDVAVDAEAARNGTLWFSDLQFYVQSDALSVQQLESDTDVSVYPNPANNILNIRLNNSNTTLKSVQLYDVTGKRVFNSNTASTIDVSNFSRGLYILKVEANNGSALNKKVIIK